MLRLILSLAFLAPTPAFAHPGHGEAASLFAGLQHPVSGPDHVTAMLAVGLLAALKGGRALWLWPLSFVGVMIAGGALGMAQLPLPLPLVEPAILASVVLLGLLVALAVDLPFALGALVIGVSALFHGHAHGLEAAGHGGLGYMIGFAATTAALHFAGIGAGLALRAASPRPLVRVAGAGCALVGAGLALNVI